MRKTAILTIGLALAFAAEASAQPSGGRGSASRHGSGSAVTGQAPTPPNQIDVIGVVEAIDPATSRLTVRYDASEPLDLPAGTMPFQVAKPSLLTGVTVGEKIRFKIDSHQITEVAPFQPPHADED